jgi:hypothetical protein
MRARLEFPMICPLSLPGSFNVQADNATRVFAPMEQPPFSSSREIYNILSLSRIALTWLRWLAFRSKSRTRNRNQLPEYYNVAFDVKVSGFIAKP